MVPHFFRSVLSGVSKSPPFLPSGPGTLITAQAYIAGTGSISATCKVQGTNTPSIEASWVDLATLSPTGTTTGVASGNTTTAFQAFRFDCTALTAGATLTASLVRG